MTCLCAAFVLMSAPAHAGGNAGVSPGGVKLYFAGGNVDIAIPITFRAEGYLGDEEQHGVGGAFVTEIGTGTFGASIVGFTPHYHYYFNGGSSSGGYVGANLDLRFRGGFNTIGIGPVGGYKHQFTDNWGLWAEASVGYATSGLKGAFGNSVRNHGGFFGMNVGVHYQWGN